MFGLELEITLEDLCVLAGNIQQGIHGFVGDIVLQVADGHRAGELAQADVLVIPVAGPGLVHLPEDNRVIPVDAVELLVCSGAQLRVRALDVGHQLAAGQLLRLTVHIQFEDVAVGDRVVERDQRPGAGYILDVDDLLLGLAQGVRLEVAHLLEIVAVITGRAHQAPGILVVEFLPPQAEEQGPVLHLGHELLDAGHIGLGDLVLGVGGKGQAGEGVDLVDDARGRLGGAHELHELVRVDIGRQLAADAFERHDLLLYVVEGDLQVRAVEAGIKLVQVPSGQGVCHVYSLLFIFLFILLGTAAAVPYRLDRMWTMSPSLTRYSLPSSRSLPLALASFIPPRLARSS